MTFQLTQSHVDEYHALGFTIFRCIVPSSLVKDLRRVTIHFREKAPEKWNLQPLGRYITELRPYYDYTNLAPLKDAIVKLLTPEHRHANVEETMGLFFEPPDEPMAREWHRDWTGVFPGMPLEDWQAICDDVRYFNQCNCALYADDATWIVPTSHLWLNSQAALNAVNYPQDPQTLDPVERERLYLSSCYAMPGAIQIHLEAGDFVIYRNTTWHRGVYLPYRKRATIFDFVECPAYAQWREKTDKQWHIGREARKSMQMA